jgi:lysophospholipase L1-like esterase
MKLLNFILALTVTAESVRAEPISRAAKPPYLFLVGDSTVNSNGGWGDGLLSYLKDTARGENRAKGGSTTISWRAEGRWEKLVAGIESARVDYEPIVTIQFGHNDQKVLTLDEFEKNLVNLATDIKKLGGTPVSPKQ